MDGLLDTSVAVDIYRGYSPATQWAQANRKLRLGITPISWLEAVEGAENKLDQTKIIKLLTQFHLTYLTRTDLSWAMQQLEIYRLSHGPDAFDCLIAAPCYRLQLPLYTRNLKHFAPLLGALAQKPY